MLRRRLEDWIETYITAHLGALTLCEDAAADPALSGHGRAILHRLTEELGLVPRSAVATHVEALAPAVRKRLAALGVRIGRTAIFLPALKDRRSVRLRIALASLYARDDARTREQLETALKSRPIATPAPSGVPGTRFHAAGYLLLDGHAVRVDAAERLAAAAAILARQGPFVPTAALSRSSGIPTATLASALTGLGFVMARNDAKSKGEGKPTKGNAAAFARPRYGARHPRVGVKPRADSPFAVLAGLVRRP